MTGHALGLLRVDLIALGLDCGLHLVAREVVAGTIPLLLLLRTPLVCAHRDCVPVPVLLALLNRVDFLICWWSVWVS